LSVIPVSSKAE
jgi:hypothetical protein